MVRILLTGYTDTEALVEAINCGLVYLYVTKPWNNDELKLRVNRALEHYVNNRKRSALEIGNARLETKLEHFKTSFIRTMGQALKARDESLFDHSWRVSCYAQRVAEVMHLGADLAQQIASAAMLHDFTALCHPADVFCNQTLPWGDVGNVELFSLLPEFTEVSDIIRFQLENFDGSGGPRGLIGDQIPLGSRILRVAAEYDLMTTSTLPLSHGQAVVILEERSGHALDPQIVEVFLANVPGIECTHLAVN
jgi:response regulator RpfG family c-di-GMP phosphodiesterase